MAVLKQIKFGSTSTPIAKTQVTAKSGGVMSVSAPDGVTNGVNEDADYQYELDVNVDNATIVKSSGSLAVGTVPAASVSVADTGDNFEGTTVEAVLAELQSNIDSVDDAAKSYTIIEAQGTQESPLPTNVLHRYQLQQTVGQNTTIVGQNIDILKDNSLLAAKLSTTDATWSGSAIVDGTGAEALVLVYKDANGDAQVIAIDVSAFLKESEFGDGLAVSAAGVVSVDAGDGLQINSTSKKVEAKVGDGLEIDSTTKAIEVKVDSTSESFLTVGANGVKVSGVATAISDAIDALDNTDTASTGQVVTAVSTANGVANPTKADLAGVTLGGFTQDATATGAIASTDTLGGALNKLENAIDAAASAASAAHTVVDHASGNTHVTVSASQPDATTGAITYTIGETNIADADDLSDEITRAQTAETAIDTAVGLTKAANAETRSFTPTTNYGTGATTVMGNMQALDTALAAVSTQVQYSVSGTTLEFFGMTAHTNS